MMSQFYITQGLYQEIWYVSAASLFFLALILSYAYHYSLAPIRQPKPLPVQTDQDAPIYKLPPELIQHVATFIHPPSAALFGLSNKSILTAIGSKVFKLEKPHRLCCLEALESQLPNHLICHICVSFHPRRRRRSTVLVYREPTCFRESGVFQYGIREFSLLFSDVQQIMNRHRFGEKHGISVKDIAYRRTSNCTRFPMLITETAEARISGGELLLRTDSRSQFHCYDRQLKMAAIYASHEFCPHASDTEMDLYTFTKSEKPFIRCSLCKTETRIRIRKFDTSYNELQITSWYTLGSCRDPFDPDDPQWRAVTEPAPLSSLIPSTEEQAVCRRAFNAVPSG